MTDKRLQEIEKQAKDGFHFKSEEMLYVLAAIRAGERNKI